MNPRARSLGQRLLGNRGLNGIVALVLILGAVAISYRAQNGVPGVPSYDIQVDIPDAAQLTKNSDVRIGGFRVGQVLQVTAMPPSRGHPPFARLSLQLQRSVEPLSADTRVRMRLGSLLGGKYIELLPGHSKQKLPPGGRLGLSHAEQLVELDSAFRLFDPQTADALRGAITGLGDSVVSQGTAINEATSAVNELLPPATGVLSVLVDPGTRLGPFVDATATASDALAPVASELADVLGQGQRTLAAVDAAGGSLGTAIDRFPPTETTGTVALRHLTPVLAQAAALAEALHPAAPLLVPATGALDGIVNLATPAARRVPEPVPALEGTLSAAQAFGTNPATPGALRVLGKNDLGSFGASLLLGLGAILRTVAPAQLYCNAASLWIRNLSSSLSEGDSAGSWIRMLPVINAGQSFQAPQPASDLHYNSYPNENASECEAGTEPYAPGQQIGNPPGLQSRTTQATGRIESEP